MNFFKRTFVIVTTAIFLSSTPSFAGDWVVSNGALGGNFFQIKNTKTGQIITEKFKKKRNAKKAAKALNKADKGVKFDIECEQLGIEC